MRSTFLLLLLVLRGVPSGAAQFAPQKIEEIERLLSAEMSKQNIPGMSIAIMGPDGTLWTNGYGLSDLENYVPAKAATMFRTASIAKPITAVAIMQLHERGKIDLDASVEKYIPTFPKKQWPVTIRHLLGHISGIRHYRDGEGTITTHYGSVMDALKAFQEDPLIAEPGTKYSYTTYGFNLLGAVVQAVSGMTYADYVRLNIFEPAGMKKTRVDDVFAIIPNRARGYARAADGSLINCALADNSVKVPGGGLLSTSEDLVRFATALGEGKLLKRETMDLMWTSLRLKDGTPTHYGLGWGVNQLNGMPQVAHTGGQAGTSCVLRYLRDRKIALVLMFNLESVQFNALADRILQLIVEPGTSSAAVR